MNIDNYITPFWIQDVSNSSWNLSIYSNTSSSSYSMPWTITVEYSTDGTTWNSFGTTSTTRGSYIRKSFTAGQKVYLRCNTTHWGFVDIQNQIFYMYNIRSSKNMKIGGNIMSLLYGSNFTGTETTFPDDTVIGIFNGLFVNRTELTDASELVLPATHATSTLPTEFDDYAPLSRCYRSMFDGCTNLVHGPQIDLRGRGPRDLPYCLQRMFYGCTSLLDVHTCLQSENRRYNATYSSISTNGTLYNYSGSTDSIAPSSWTVKNIISMYLDDYRRVIDWQSNTMGRIYKVTDSNNDIIYKKDIVTPDDLKYLADTYDYSYPAGSKSVKIKNISGEPIVVTLTSRATTKFNQDPTYTYDLTYYDNSNTAHQLTFSINNLSYDIPVGVDEVISADFVDAMLSNNDLLGFTQPTILSSTGYIALIGGELDTVNKRMPFRFDNSSKLVDASKFYWRINNSVQYTDEFIQGSFMELFSGSSHLVYPAILDWTESGSTFVHLYHRTYYNCTNLRTVSTIRVPSHIRTFRMCYQTYSNCIRLTNVDNALVFHAAVSDGTAYTNNYATRKCAYGAHVSGLGGVVTQILDRTCYETFKGCTAITSAKFSLPWAMCYSTPSDGYTQGAYYGLFDGCTSLVEPPKLERYYCAEGSSGGFSYYRGYSINAYHRIFRNCTSLNKLVLVSGDTTRWYCPDYEYSFVGGSWTQSTNKTNLTEWLNPAQSGTIYYEGNQPREVGTPSDGYLPNWTFTTNDWF